MAEKIIVTQIGARHRYLIPEVLDKNGLLYRFYTDSCRFSLLGRLASFLTLFGLHSPNFKRLILRTPRIHTGKLFSTDILFCKSILFSLCRRSELQKLYLVFNGIEKRCRKWGVGDADCVYGMYFENFGFLKYAKSKGLKIIVDIYERPMTYKCLVDEILSNPEFEVFRDCIPAYERKHEVRMHYIEDLLELADYYTVPSTFVTKSLRQFRNFDEKKVILQPYASSIASLSYRWKPVRHRVLFVGSDAVNKGVLYCAKAATILKERFPDLDFRVVGSGFERIEGNEVFKDLHFLGFYDRTRLLEEYCSAEVFVFPTLFEGFAGAVIEAACCGCPIITTENAGTDVNEFPAIYIPEKDYLSIVGEVTRIFEDSEYRDKLSRDVYHYGETLSPRSYEKKITDLFKQI